jgi:hypothetical protein
MYVYVSVSICWPVRKNSSRVCMDQEVGNLKESMHWHLHDERPVLLAWRARLRQPPVLHQHVGHGLAHRLPGCRPLKNNTEFQNKWSLVVCSATRHAQCIPTAHIQPQVNSGSHLAHSVNLQVVIYWIFAPLGSDNSHFFKLLFTKMAVSMVSDP